MNELNFSDFIQRLRDHREALRLELAKAIADTGRGSGYSQYIAGRLDEITVCLNAAQEISCNNKAKAA